MGEGTGRGERLDGINYTITAMPNGGNGKVAVGSNGSYSGTTVSIPATIEVSGDENPGTYDVTAIGIYAFDGCTALTSVTIPDSVTTIDMYAFRNCDALVSVTIGNSVKTISVYSFEDCTSLMSVDIPDSVETIDDWAFSGCENLASVTIGKSVTTINTAVFYQCNLLNEVIFKGNTAPSIGNGAFDAIAENGTVSYPMGGTGYEDIITEMGLGDNADGWTNTAEDMTAPELTDETAIRDSDTDATVKFTSSEDGTYYWQIGGTASTAAELVNSPQTASRVMYSDENTINLTTLTAAVQTVYIAAKDEAGNVSNLLTVPIPEYVAPTKTISVNAQTDTLTAGTAGSATFTVTTENIANDSEITLNNTNGVTGISLVTTRTTGNSTDVTINTATETPQGSHPLTLTINDIVSDGFTLTVEAAPPLDVAPTITAQPTNRSIMEGNNTTFIMAASGNPAPGYQWQVSTDSGGNWSDITNGGVYSGAATPTLTLAAVPLAYSGHQYRCVATNSKSSATSIAATLTVAPMSVDVAPAITAQPADSRITAGNNTTFTVAASGTPAPGYQWQVSTDSGGNWSDIGNGGVYSGAATPTLTLAAVPLAYNSYQYRCVATNRADTATSNAAMLTVTPAPTPPPALPPYSGSDNDDDDREALILTPLSAFQIATKPSAVILHN